MQQVLFEERFLDQYTGKKLLKDPITAIVELVANSWDAGATRVDITWPTDATSLIIKDNGEGMTENEFTRRWLTLSYNRLAEQGDSVQVVGQAGFPPRKTFGRNGIGRFAGFCFGNIYEISTVKAGMGIRYSVRRGVHSTPLELIKLEETISTTTGTTIRIENSSTGLSAERIKSEIGMRFLSDPSFKVYVNNSRIAFNDLPSDGFENYYIDLPETNERLRIALIDTKRTDRTTKLHGVAWQVNGRLVGNCSWQGSGQEALIDGRRIEAKRYTFIIFADILDDPEIIRPDWSGFQEEHPRFLMVKKSVQDKIRELLLGLTKERRQETYNHIQQTNIDKLRRMSPIGRVKWEAFVEKAQEDCPSLAVRDLVALSGVLANLELTSSRYTLIHQLHEMEPEQLSNLHEVLRDWNIDNAKIVLDELQWRLSLINELLAKTSSSSTLEVQELQPLFEKGLWIFGPEFETIEFTSNEGMTRVVQTLFKSTSFGSRNRPDFVILPDGTVGLYSYPEYDEECSEIGVASLVVVELKSPGVNLGSEQKDQCWKYVKELYSKGHLTDRTKVRCFVLGLRIDSEETDRRTEKDGRVIIQPLLFNTVLDRAKSRVLKLYDKIKSAPFLQEEHIDNFLNFNEPEIEDPGLLDTIDTDDEPLQISQDGESMTRREALS